MATRRGATRSPAVVLRDVRRTLESGWPDGLTVLSGDDLYHLDAAMQSILEKLLPTDAPDLALTVYGETKVDVATVVASARSMGMFAPLRVVLVRDVAALDGDAEPLAGYAREPPAGSHLLVRAPELDRRRKLHQLLAKAGRCLVFAAGSSSGSGRQVAELARTKGLQLDSGAAALLAEACAGDFYRIDAELEKLRAWMGGEPGARVGVEQVRDVVAGSGLLSGWEIADAVLARDAAAATAAVRKLVQDGEAPLRLLGGLAYRARTMLQAKAMLDQGAGTEQVKRTVRAWGFDRELFRGLSRYTSEELLRFPSLLLEADRTMKSRSIDPRTVLEVLVERMTGGVAASDATNR